MSNSQPVLIKVYETFDGNLVFIKEALLTEKIAEFGSQAAIPDTEIIEAILLVMEQNEISPVYELRGLIKIYKLSLLVAKYVRCSNLSYSTINFT